MDKVVLEIAELRGEPRIGWLVVITAKKCVPFIALKELAHPFQGRLLDHHIGIHKQQHLPTCLRRTPVPRPRSDHRCRTGVGCRAE